jgi:hypothetical protein
MNKNNKKQVAAPANPKPFKQNQMPARRNRQKLRQPLHRP